MGCSGFSCNLNSRDSLGAYVTCIYCGLSMNINMSKVQTVREDRGHICFAFVFACVVGKNLNGGAGNDCLNLNFRQNFP